MYKVEDFVIAIYCLIEDESPRACIRRSANSMACLVGLVFPPP